MNKARELKKKYGDHYLFRKHLTDRQIARLKSVPPDPFPDTVATSLEVGCMRLDAVLFRSPSGLELGYDILVKDAPNSREWIFYDAVSADSLKETAMAAELDQYITEHGLSYTDCGFTRVDGKTVNEKKSKPTPDC